ncbi:MAG TPA: response regulator [Cyclobacteriaceae bacterium]|jgi:CRP-like cAMP-binding protein
MKTILLIEDNQDVLENTAEILELANYKVMTANNGRAGVELAQKNMPDLIVCDIMMPELDGYGVLHILSKNEKTAGIPFIFLTAKADRADLRKGMNLGADDYLTKPFDDTELLDSIESRLRKSDLMKKNFQRSVEGINEFIQDAATVSNIDMLISNHKLRMFKKKASVFHETDYPNHLYFISSGRVKTFKSNQDGKDLILGVHSTGEFLGYNALITNTSYSESAEALEDSELYVIPKQDFESLMYTNRDVTRKFIQILSDNLQEKEEQMLHLAYNSVRQRVAEALINLEEKYNSTTPGETLTISREDLANIVGTSPESVIRTLSDFKDEKSIEIKSGKIRILDPGKLEKIVSWNR